MAREGKRPDRCRWYKRSLPFTISRMPGVIGSQSSHWSGRLIRVLDKDKDKDKDVLVTSNRDIGYYYRGIGILLAFVSSFTSVP